MSTKTDIRDATKVLVIGAGIGGLTAGAALSQAGHDVRVIEIKPDLESSVLGVGVIQPGNALRALDVIGCADACVELGYGTSHPTLLMDSDGDTISELAGFNTEGGRFPNFNGITRPNLHQILTDRLLELGGTLDYATTFTEIRQVEDGAQVTFGDGSTEEFDLVVGADGVRSAVRAAVFGADIQPAWNGLGSFRSNIPRVIDGEREIDRLMRQKSGEREVGFAPIGKDLAYAFFNCAWDPDRRLTDAEAVEIFREFLEPFGGLAGRVRDEFLSEKDVLFRPMDLLIVGLPWHRDRVVLTGDALHAVTPHLGQGAALAVEDGIVLGEVLGTGDSIEADLTAYGARRYERCRDVVEACGRISEWELDPATEGDRGNRVKLAKEISAKMLQPI